MLSFHAGDLTRTHSTVALDSGHKRQRRVFHSTSGVQSSYIAPQSGPHHVRAAGSWRVERRVVVPSVTTFWKDKAGMGGGGLCSLEN